MTQINDKPVLYFISCAAVAIVLTAMALCIDLMAWMDGMVSDSAFLRFVRTVMCAAAAIAAVSAPLHKSDRFVIPLALLIAVMADFFLVLKNDLVTGIGLFAVMQMVLIARHVQGLDRLTSPHRLLAPSLVGVAVLAIGNTVLWPALAPKGLAIPVLAYSSLLITSVLAARAAGLTGRLSGSQATYALVGMVLFLLCDVTVGIGAAYGQTSFGQFMRSLTGLFYTPSLLLLVRSGMR